MFVNSAKKYKNKILFKKQLNAIIERKQKYEKIRSNKRLYI